jgi:L-ribulokinase
MNNRFVFGIDFGTESARAVLVEVSTGKLAALATESYKHGVITDFLPDTSIRLESQWALQNPQDYIDSLISVVKTCIKTSGVNPEQVIGIGVDFTASTVLPIDKNGNPLCFDPNYRNNPHSWVKLWKHHAAEKEAADLNELAKQRDEHFLRYYGGSISPEWMLPKVFQIIREAPEIYDATYRFIEAGDWIVFRLTGELKRNSCAAGYKGMWNKKNGYPVSDFLKALHPKLEHFVQDKLDQEVYPVGQYAGKLTRKMAAELGLTENVSVATATIDAHAAVPGSGIVEPGKMLMVMGTSICHMIMAEDEKFIPGVNGVVEDGILPGFFGYEAGQAAGGDTLAWFVRNGVPSEYKEEAEKRNCSVYALLEEKVKSIRPGQSGLIALDWLNGNRSILNNPILTGLVLGITLETKPEDIYLAFMESLAFGTRTIIESFENGGIPVHKLYACGGLPLKNQLLMQIFANVTGKNIEVVTSPNASALGAAMFGAIAAGKSIGGYDTIFEAAQAMSDKNTVQYTADPKAHQVYNQLYQCYKSLHDYFGSERDSVMKQLKEIKKSIE